MKQNIIIRSAVAGLALLVGGGCPQPTNTATITEQNIQTSMQGLWENGDGVQFYFDENGLDYYGKEQFGESAFDRDLSREFTSKQYGTGKLYDSAQIQFENNQFNEILKRDLQISDFFIEESAMITGQLVNDSSLQLEIYYTDMGNGIVNDFYGASIGDGTYVLHKVK